MGSHLLIDLTVSLWESPSSLSHSEVPRGLGGWQSPMSCGYWYKDGGRAIQLSHLQWALRAQFLRSQRNWVSAVSLGMQVSMWEDLAEKLFPCRCLSSLWISFSSLWIPSPLAWVAGVLSLGPTLTLCLVSVTFPVLFFPGTPIPHPQSQNHGSIKI